VTTCTSKDNHNIGATINEACHFLTQIGHGSTHKLPIHQWLSLCMTRALVHDNAREKLYRTFVRASFAELLCLPNVEFSDRLPDTLLVLERRLSGMQIRVMVSQVPVIIRAYRLLLSSTNPPLMRYSCNHNNCNSQESCKHVHGK